LSLSKVESILVHAMSAALLLLSTGNATAQAGAGPAYPQKAVRLIVPYSPGGGTDILARLFARKLGEDWSAPVVVENHPGGNTDIGTSLVARAPADGHVLLLATPANVLNPQLSPKTPYDIKRDFAAVALLGDVPNLLLIRASLPFRSLAEMLSFAASKPGELTYASGGVGSPQHFSLELLKHVAKVDIRHIPYKGGGPATTDLLAGHVDMMASSAVLALPHLTSGKLKALVVASPGRLESAPEVQTSAEAGVPAFIASTWFGLMAPSGTPHATILQINQSIRRAMTQPDVIESLGKLGAQPNQWSEAQFSELITNETKKWGEVIKAAGIKID
jgi:tripartite-type tricarboxylate transporter receptor subunit TctC